MLLVYEQVERMVNTQWTPDSPVMVSLKMMLPLCISADPKLICEGSGREKPSWSWTTRHNSWRNQHQRSDSWRHTGTQSGGLWESGLKISRDSRWLQVKKTYFKVGVPRKSFDSSLLVLFCRWGELILFEKIFHFQGVDLGQLGQPGSLRLIRSGFPLFNLICWENQFIWHSLEISVVVKM